MVTYTREGDETSWSVITYSHSTDCYICICRTEHVISPVPGALEWNAVGTMSTFLR